jgi:uncharacterized protein (TIGR02246 family)
LVDAQRAVLAFAAELGRGRPAAAAAWFTQNGCMITPDGTAVNGREAVRGLLEQLVARRTEIEIEQMAVRLAGDVAQALGRWAIASNAADGGRFVQPCDSVVILHRIEGDWRLAIVAPWG